MSAPTPALERNPNERTFTDSTHSSTSSAERYRLDEEDRRPILLYNYHGSLETSSQRDLCTWLDKNEQSRVTRKKIPRATGYVDVKRHDLYLPEEKDRYAEKPNYNSSIASVKVPSHAYWSRFFLGNYDELYIVSPESSPASSLASSVEGSRQVSPSNTFQVAGSNGS